MASPELEQHDVSGPAVPGEAYQHRGQWVVIRCGAVVAAAAQIDELRGSDVVRPSDTLFHVPAHATRF